MEVKHISIKNIMFGEGDLRQHDPKADYVVEKMESMELRGILNLFRVEHTSEAGIYIIGDGSVRLTALKAYYDQHDCLPEKVNPDSDSDTIAVQVIEKQTETSRYFDQLTGNASVTKTTNKEYIDMLYKVSATGEYTNKEIAKEAGISEQHFNNLMKTLKLGPEALKAAEEKGVSITNLISLSPLAKLVEDDEIMDYVETASKTTVPEFAKLVNDKIIAIRKAAKDGGEVVKGYKHVAKLLKKEQLQMLYVQAQSAFDNDGSPENEVRLSVFKEIWQDDEVSKANGKAAYDANKADQETAKEARKEKREKEKYEEMKKKYDEEKVN